MKKAFFVVSAMVAMLFVAACGSGEKTNPIWGLWVQKPAFGPKTEIMFNDDNTGFVFVADTVKYETRWQQDTLLRVIYVEPSAAINPIGEFTFYRVTIDGDVMKLEERKTGKVTSYSRYIEK